MGCHSKFVIRPSCRLEAAAAAMNLDVLGFLQHVLQKAGRSGGAYVFTTGPWSLWKGREVTNIRTNRLNSGWWTFLFPLKSDVHQGRIQTRGLCLVPFLGLGTRDLHNRTEQWLHTII